MKRQVPIRIPIPGKLILWRWKGQRTGYAEVWVKGVRENFVILSFDQTTHENTWLSLDEIDWKQFEEEKK